MNWGKVLVGLVVIAIGTFVAAYYVPLYRAHDTLSQEHRRVTDKIQALGQSLAQAQQSVSSLESKLRALESERQEREAGNSRTAAEVERLQAALSSSLDRYTKRGGVSLARDGNQVVVAIADTAVFAPRKLDVTSQGRALLCDVAKGVGSGTLDVRAFDSGEEPEPALAAKFPNVWALRAARAASLAEVLAGKCGVQPARLVASGVGDTRPSSSGTKMPVERIEIRVSKPSG